ncbi:hypothetical protein BpHYR1_018715 [Brachionus plicatilis]|uniref:Uncharacterized protein n=1 Tax=Brachionus plicatilis TaxID=10195 RepID=A0A3M7PHA8_BRAPC|nr:hypothetical protein BpHYR1_018715 [Brachionus plicatilis]
MSLGRGEKFEFVKHLEQLVVARSLEQNNVQKLILIEFSYIFIFHANLKNFKLLFFKFFSLRNKVKKNA